MELSKSKINEETCRACLNANAKTDLFSEHKVISLKYSSLLHELTALKVKHEDGLPNKICTKCSKVLVNFHKFKTTVIVNDLSLRNALRIVEDSKNASNEFDNPINGTKGSIVTEDKNHIELSDKKFQIALEDNINPNLNYSKEIPLKVDNVFSRTDNRGKQIELGTNNIAFITDSGSLDQGTMATEDKIPSNGKLQIALEDNIKSNLLNYSIEIPLKLENVSRRTDVPGKQIDLGTNGIAFVTDSSSSDESEEEKNENPNSKQKVLKDNFKVHQCEICGKILSCKSNLTQHLRKHTGERPYACDVCGKTFFKAEHALIHKRIHTGERPHKCLICSRRFIQFATLKAHLRTHSGERPHQCFICGKAFSQASSLVYHNRIHSGETPFKCNVCSKAFKNVGNLNIHMRFHQNERPYVCHLCDKKFVTSSHLNVHLKQHKGEKPHKCVVCGKAFVRSEHLKGHLVIHSGQKPYACKLCPKKYTQSSHLKRHLKTHSIEIKPEVA